MAEMIRNRHSRMTAGERKVERCLKSLPDDCLCWYDIPVGEKRRYPDFIVLHRRRGLLLLEVKDWRPKTLKKINKTEVELLTDKGLCRVPHPLEQARQYAYLVIGMLSRDPQLQQEDGKYKGQLIMPYGWGVVFTNISRQQIVKAIPDDSREIILPDHKIIYGDELSENSDPEVFQRRLFGMVEYQFGTTLDLSQINRIRWHLFPDMRIGDKQSDWVTVVQGEPSSFADNVPAASIKTMDIPQEKLARGLGEGHRIIHGVAGSGKTLILCYRCLQLAKTSSSKPILVLCFNISLAARLQCFIDVNGIAEQVQVRHFHGWCVKQLKTHKVPLIKAGDKDKIWERQVASVMEAVDKGLIPYAQYSALLIDEGHDFAAESLALMVKMVDPASNSLLLLYDDAQSIYKKNTALGFSFSSIGIQARGRTTILKRNYRNTREILNFAYAVACHRINPCDADDDHVPLLEPQAAGTHGDKPEVHSFSSVDEEVSFTRSCLQKWHQLDVPWSDMAVLCLTKNNGNIMSKFLKQDAIPHLWMNSGKNKAAYDIRADKVTVVTIHSSKGLEFPYVVIIGVGFPPKYQDDAENLRLLYVGMTRAQESLLLTTSKNNKLSQRLFSVSEK